MAQISLNDFQGKILILIFYQSDFVRETQDFLSTFNGLSDDKVQIAACSVDSVFAHNAWRGQFQLDFPLIADKSHSLADSFGVLDHEEGHAEKAAFVIDEQGKIRHFLLKEFSVNDVSQLIKSVIARAVIDYKNMF